MRDDVVLEGITAGIIAGAVMMAAEIAYSVAVGTPALSPIRLVSSIVLGPAALSRTYPPVTALAVGAGLHLILAAVFGLIAFLALARSRRPDASAALLLISGAAFGALLWAVNFLIVGSTVLPQFSVVNLVWNGLIAHAVCFGLALGGYAAAKRPPTDLESTASDRAR